MAGAASGQSFRKEGSLPGHKSRVFDICWSPAQPLRLASVGETCACIWSVDDAAGRVSFPGTELMRVCWHPDGNHVLIGDGQGKICVHAAADGEQTAVLDASSEDEVYGLKVLSSDGLLAAGAGNTMQLWDLTKATMTTKVTLAPAQGGVVFGGEHRNPDAKCYVFGLEARGRILSVALSDGTVRLMDSETLQVLASLNEHARRGAGAFTTALSPTSPLLVSCDGQGTVLLWDLRSLGQGPLAETHSSAGAVHAAAFVPAGDGASEQLVTGGDDRRLRLHELSGARALETVGSVSVLSPVLCVDVAPDAAPPRLASGGGSGGLLSDATVALWRLDSKEDGSAAEGAAKKRQRQEEEDEDEAEDEGDAKSEKGTQKKPPADATAACEKCMPCQG